MMLACSLLFVLMCGGTNLANDPPAQPAARVGPAPEARVERAGAGREFDLRPKWVVGDVQRYTYELMNFNGAQAVDDAKKRSGQLFRQEGRLARKVVSSDEKGTVLALTFERFYLQESRNTKVQYYDSDFGDDATKANYLTPRVKKWLGKTITVKLDKDGAVVGIEGLDSDRPVGPLADVQIQKEPVDVDAVIVKKMWRPLYRLDKPVLTAKIGETWTTSDSGDDPELGKFDLSIHHELKDVTGGTVTIESTADVKHTPLADAAGMNVKMTSSKLSGTFEWDLKRGSLKSWSTDQEVKMAADRAGAQLVLTSKTVTNFKWLDPEAPKEDPKTGAPAAAGAAGTGTAGAGGKQ